MIPRKLTQAQAARAAGVTRTQIHRFIKSGRLSAEKSDGGEVVIDPSELLRVYPQADLERAVTTGNSRHRDGIRVTPEQGRSAPEAVLLVELREHRDRLQAELDRERAAREAERREATEERARLLRLVEQQGDQLRLLTDQRPAPSSSSWWARWRPRKAG